MVWLAISLIVVAFLYLEVTNCAASNTDGISATFKNSDFSNLVMGYNRTSVSDTSADIKEVQNVDYGSGTESVTSNFVEESRKQKQNKKQQGFMQRILPMMVIPFMVSTSMIPMMLIAIKFMLLKSAFLGVVGISLMLLNMFRRRTNTGGVFNHNIKANDEAMMYYGYHGDEEYGAYVNRRRRKRETK